MLNCRTEIHFKWNNTPSSLNLQKYCKIIRKHKFDIMKSIRVRSNARFSALQHIASFGWAYQACSAHTNCLVTSHAHFSPFDGGWESNAPQFVLHLWIIWCRVCGDEHGSKSSHVAAPSNLVLVPATATKVSIRTNFVTAQQQQGEVASREDTEKSGVTIGELRG